MIDVDVCNFQLLAGCSRSHTIHSSTRNVVSGNSSPSVDTLFVWTGTAIKPLCHVAEKRVDVTAKSLYLYCQKYISKNSRGQIGLLVDALLNCSQKEFDTGCP